MRSLRSGTCINFSIIYADIDDIVGKERFCDKEDRSLVTKGGSVAEGSDPLVIPLSNKGRFLQHKRDRPFYIVKKLCVYYT